MPDQRSTRVTQINIKDLDWEKMDGLIPAIVQDDRSGSVLMLGYVSRESLEKTEKSRSVTFYSRSRNTLWTKGESSGNILALKDIFFDCDRDSVLIKASPHGPTCHLGQISCFGDESQHVETTLTELTRRIQTRREASKSESYTAKLLAKGTKKIAQKVGEEAVEVAIAAVAEKDRALLDESADLIYHLLVLLESRDLSINDVEQVLESRKNKSK